MTQLFFILSEQVSIINIRRNQNYSYQNGEIKASNYLNILRRNYKYWNNNIMVSINIRSYRWAKKSYINYRIKMYFNLSSKKKVFLKGFIFINYWTILKKPEMIEYFYKGSSIIYMNGKSSSSYTHLTNNIIRF
jgi:hypothetical protein